MKTSFDENNDRGSRWRAGILVVISMVLLGTFGLSSYKLSTGISTTTTTTTTTIDVETTAADIPRYSGYSEDDKSKLFKQFKSDHSRTYQSDDEERQRYENFKAFLERIDERNEAELANGGSGYHDVTIFADISEEEFASSFLGYNPSQSKHGSLLKHVSENDNIDLENPDTPGDSVTNWAGIYTTSVNNQGYCGSCWAFSSVEQLESDSIMAGYTNTSEKFSYEQVTSCAVSNGCEVSKLKFIAYMQECTCMYAFICIYTYVLISRTI